MSMIMLLLLFNLMLTASYEFEYFQMVQQWPPTFCSGIGVTCKVQPPQNKFTIHGLWPSNFSNAKLICSGGDLQQNKLPHRLSTKLKKYWPNLKCGNDFDFWRYEWRKHGRCSNPPLNPNQYLHTTIRMYLNYDLLGMLNAAGLSPSTTFRQYTYMENVLKNAIGAVPSLRCNVNSQSNEDQLYEIVICFEENSTNLIDCTYAPGNCPDWFVW
ncbi:ribonuclease MC-like [Cucurbita pepo subsp. pepo]|uniref:ribonuclease MC-like n=1 Tax=Cucurbita pepo subsp. pepo TaxID=3664 RepID=UPI000C9D88F9|nr:ribonuclease MC-like [Cucurbita pepo subsp. pepo]